MVMVDAPPAAERRDRRPAVALGLALVAVALAAAAAGAWNLAISTSDASHDLLAAAVPALGTGLAPVLALASVTIVLRMRGVLSVGRSTAIIALGAIALPLAALASASWSVGFDDADAGRPITGLGALTVPLALGSLVAGASLLGLLLHAVLVVAGMSRASAAGLALLLALLGAPAAGFALVSPASSAALAVAATVVAAFATRSQRSPRSPRPAQAAPSIRPPGPARPPVADRSTNELAIGLARLAAGAGVAGVLFSILAPALWPVPIDGTEALIVGISILLASGVPLLAAVVLLVEARFSVAALLVRGPATALVLALAAMGYWYTSGPDGDANWWAVSVASLFLGVAVGGMSFLLPLSRPVAIAVGLAVALALAAAQVAAFLPMLAFAVPVVAIVIVVVDAVSARRRDRGMPSAARRRRIRRPSR